MHPIMGLFALEKIGQPLLSRPQFYRRLARFAVAALILIAFSWLIGILGYKVLEGMGWVDAILNSAMILGGMGPVDTLHTDAGKLFASFYALFSGIVFLASSSLLVAPLLHRFLHSFNVAPTKAEEEGDDDDDKDDHAKAGDTKSG
jgi:hypothetical protein